MIKTYIELSYYPIMVSLHICNENRNTLQDFSSKICVANEIEDKYI